MKSDDSTLLVAALAYASLGWAVLPLHTPRDGRCSCGRAECHSVGKHPHTRRGVKDATSDPETIRRWWERWPEANIGVATGTTSGIVALDVDGQDGEAALRELCGNPPTPTSYTGRGRHAIFAAPDEPVKNRVALAPQLDLRGDGGYFVAPPSLHASGVHYTWDQDHGLGPALPPAPLPSTVLQHLAADPTPLAGHPWERGGALRIPEGERNVELTSLAGRLARAAQDREQVVQELAVVNRARCDPPLPEPEVRGIADRVWRLEEEQRAKAGGRGPKGGGPSVAWTVISSAYPASAPHGLADLGYLLDLARLIKCNAEMPILTGKGRTRPAWVGHGEAEIAHRFLENRWGWTRKHLRRALLRWQDRGLIEILPLRSRTHPTRIRITAWVRCDPAWGQATRTSTGQASASLNMAARNALVAPSSDREGQAESGARGHKSTASTGGRRQRWLRLSSRLEVACSSG